MNKRKGFADQVAKKAKVNLQPVPTEDQETLEPSQEKTVHIRRTFP